MSTWIYGSDARGQITSARKRLDAAAGAPFAPGWDASYAYDDLGNRVTWGQGSAQQTDLSDLEPTSYSRNALHQYTAISGVNASRVTGQAPAAQEVKINGVTAERAGHFYHRRVQDGARSDLTLPHWLQVTVTATTTLPNQQTVTAQRAGSLWQPPIPEEPVYDFDGNLIEDGRWLYTWDGENRLIQMLTRPAAVAAGAPNWRLSFAYDHQSRRIQKKVEVLNGSVWEVRSDARFIYDGWNVVAEVELNGAAWDAPGGTSAMDPRPAYVRRSWVWGEDVSGTMGGAGGVGGLLVVTRHARGGQGRESYWAMSDLNGNVTGLVSTTSGRMAVYEYDAFGRLLRENEPEPGLNPVRFSSKYQDVETGLVYYGYRYYAPEMGRWISRDPIEEQGGVNLYGMVGNDAVNNIDTDGRVPYHERIKPTPWTPELVEQRFPKLIKGLKEVYIKDINRYVRDKIYTDCQNGPKNYPGPSRRFLIAPAGERRAPAVRIPDEPFVDPTDGSTDYPIDDSHFGDTTQDWWDQRFGLGQFVVDVKTPVSIIKKCYVSSCEYKWSTTMYLEDNAGDVRVFFLPEKRVVRAKWTISSEVQCCVLE